MIPEPWLQLPLVERLLRLRYVIVVVVAIVLTAAGSSHGDGDWSIFARGARHFGPHVYADVHDLVIGPFALAITRVIVDAGGYWIAVVLAVSLGVVAVWIAELASHRFCPGHDTRLAALIGGVILMGPWTTLALYGHFEDALVLTLAVAAVAAVGYRHPLLVGTCLGVAVASKPWAVVFVPIVLAVPPRARLGAFGLTVAIAAVAWAPFLLAEPHATTANNVFVAVDSVWHLFGASDLASSWMRFLDLVVATGLTAIVSRRALPAAVLIAVAWRVALDPATWPYYWAGVVLGALVFDLLGTRSTIPYWTAIAFVVVASAEELGIDGAGRAVLRIAFAVAVLAVALWPRTPARQAAR